MTYKPMDTAPEGVRLSVLTRAKNVRGCVILDGIASYRNVHGEWHGVELDPPESWWDGTVPGYGYLPKISERVAELVRADRAWEERLRSAPRRERL